VSIATGKARLGEALDRILFAADDACEQVWITRPSGAAGALDPVTHLITDPAPTDVYGSQTAGAPALVAPDTSNRQPEEQGGTRQYPERYRGRFPKTVVVEIGDTVTVVASPAAHLVGRSFIVEEVPDSGRHVDTICFMYDSSRGPRL
jgi:hypothetical protein